MKCSLRIAATAPPSDTRSTSLRPLRRSPSSRTPYTDALKHDSASSAVPLHLPGHARGRADTIERNDATILGAPAAYDADQNGALGNLLDRTGPIGEAQRAAQRAYGARETNLTVGGGSSASHASAIRGLLLRDALPCDVVAETHDPSGLTLPMTA